MWQDAVAAPPSGDFDWTSLLQSAVGQSEARASFVRHCRAIAEAEAEAEKTREAREKAIDAMLCIPE